MIGQTILCVAAISSLVGIDAGAKLAVTETTRSDTTKTVTQQAFSSMTEESTCCQSQWKVEASIPFSADDWRQLGQDGTISLKIGKQLVEKKISPSDGFKPTRNSFTFKLTRPVGVATGFKYLTLPTDKPLPPAPPAGTRVVYGNGSLEFKNGTLKMDLWSAGKSGPSLLGESFVAVGDGSFEGRLPFEITVGNQHHVSELNITGTAKHRDKLNNDTNGSTVVGTTVQLALTGKA